MKLEILELDPFLAPYESFITHCHTRYLDRLALIRKTAGSLSDFANAWLHFGIHEADEGFYYREWAPEARALYLTGDFNGWDMHSHPLAQGKNGEWALFLPRADYAERFRHGTRIKVNVVSARGEECRIPLFIRRTVQDEETKDFCGIVWLPEERFHWTDASFTISGDLFIYEAHVGMSQEEPKIGTYREFADLIIPYVKKQGYTAIQLMAVMEHPYYGSFGYQVSNFYAASSRFGTPEDLKCLVNRAHGEGLAVLLDCVHSHAVKNTREGINGFDGTDYQFFHKGPKGDHPVWDSKLFNYGSDGVIHFLLSNLKFWLDEYHFDGFRFDGVTSMLYDHHGLGKAFTHYDMYFGGSTDIDALVYLKLATTLVREVKSTALTIAEDMSGFPGMCIPVSAGGIGFDYRLAMGLPDYFEKLASKTPDEQWNMFELWHQLTDRRKEEAYISYTESHDQAMVGGKTILFHLLDADMYYKMKTTDESIRVDRGMALHKIFRLLCAFLGGEGYLTFMGNEFGHPEWVDFPRAGNNWSYHHARRLWSLATDPKLRYRFLLEFDREILRLVSEAGFERTRTIDGSFVDNEKKVISFSKCGLSVSVNLNAAASYEGYWLRVAEPGIYAVRLDSDSERFGGHRRVDSAAEYPSFTHEGLEYIRIYSPNRTALVYKLINR